MKFVDCLAVLSENQTVLQAGIAARTMANIADILGCMAGPKGGLRSGPAANTTWSQAFHYLEVSLCELLLYPGKSNVFWDILELPCLCLSMCLSVYKILVSFKVLVGVLSHI